ncbi:hypothetical protein [Marispirochaeta aestuarii]|uniref:hypothetical protein n=1 Tax=Marispirochaeta aestuarii TaxID=1963862 RepID=UPI0029C74081|nr:hypothetical protein [Marispirochaeta aestuarii]
MKKIASLVTVLVIMTVGLFAQTEPDPAVQEAKEETAVVYDLGRFFGYVHGMTTENPKLALTDDQKSEIREIMDRIKGMKRVEPAWAEETLEYLELDLLSPAQLMEVDRRAIEWQNSRETSSTAGTGAGAGTGPISSYLAGGPFNPIIDETKTIGQGFAALYKYLD